MSESPASARVGESAWPAWQRIAFRFFFLYWLLYAFPSPFSKLFDALVFGLGKVAALGTKWNLFDVDLTSWADPVQAWLVTAQGDRLSEAAGGAAGATMGWWRDLTSWISETAAAWSDGAWSLGVVHAPGGTGDTAHDFVRLGCIVVFAGVLTAVWSLFARGSGHLRLGLWAHLAARWHLALVLLSYGLARVSLGPQADLGLAELMRPVGDHAPHELVTLFENASPSYHLFGGFVELAAFALLLHRRTVLLGCVAALAVFGSLGVLSFTYGVPSKIVSANSVLLVLLLMAPFRQRLWALFVSNRFSESIEIRVARSRWLGYPMLLAGVLWAVDAAWMEHEHLEAVARRQEERAARPQWFGLWNVERMALDGAEVAADDPTAWSDLGIDRGHRAWVRTRGGDEMRFRCDEADSGAGGKELTLTPADGGEPLTLRPEPLPAAPDRIVWRGQWGGRALELQAERRPFPLLR